MTRHPEVEFRLQIFFILTPAAKAGPRSDLNNDYPGWQLYLSGIAQHPQARPAQANRNQAQHIAHA